MANNTNYDGDTLLSEWYPIVKANFADIYGIAEEHKKDASNPHKVTKSQVGLGNVDNTSDKNKPVSNAVQAALDKKTDKTSFEKHTSDKTNPHGVTKAQVGLDNADNTSDMDKPVSTAVQTALDGKANKSHTHTKSEVGLENVLNIEQVGKTEFSEFKEKINKFTVDGDLGFTVTKWDIEPEIDGIELNTEYYFWIKDSSISEVTAFNYGSKLYDVVDENKLADNITPGNVYVVKFVEEYTRDSKGDYIFIYRCITKITDYSVDDFNRLNGELIKNGSITRDKIADSSFDDVPKENSNALISSGGVYAALSGKAGTSHAHVSADITDKDTAPTENSGNLITSGGVYGALENMFSNDDCYFTDLNTITKPGAYGVYCESKDAAGYNYPEGKSYGSLLVVSTTDGVNQVFVGQDNTFYTRFIETVSNECHEWESLTYKITNELFEIKELNFVNLSDFIKSSGSNYYDFSEKVGEDYFWVYNDFEEGISELYYNDDVKYVFTAEIGVGKYVKIKVEKNVVSDVDGNTNGEISVSPIQYNTPHEYVSKKLDKEFDSNGYKNIDEITAALKSGLSGGTNLHTHANKDILDGITGVDTKPTNGSNKLVTSGGVYAELSKKADTSHTHTKANITDFPTSMKNPNSLTLTMNGTASTYNGESTASKSWYAPTTAGTAGYELVSGGNGAPVWKAPAYAVCSTAAATAAKTVSVTNFMLVAGVSVKIKFTYANSASTPTLNVNGTGAKQIVVCKGNTSYPLSGGQTWTAGEIVEFVYNGGYWVAVSSNQGFMQKKYNTVVIGTATSGHTYANADYICNGTNDNTVFQTAVNNMPKGGTIKVLAGRYNFSSPVEIPSSNYYSYIIEGEGVSYSTSYVTTMIYCTNHAFAVVKNLGVELAVKNISFYLAGTLSGDSPFIKSNGDVTLTDCKITASTTAVSGDTNYIAVLGDVNIQNCDIDIGRTFTATSMVCASFIDSTNPTSMASIRGCNIKLTNSATAAADITANLSLARSYISITGCKITLVGKSNNAKAIISEGGGHISNCYIDVSNAYGDISKITGQASPCEDGSFTNNTVQYSGGCYISFAQVMGNFFTATNAAAGTVYFNGIVPIVTGNRFSNRARNTVVSDSGSIIFVNNVLYYSCTVSSESNAIVKDNVIIS